MRTLTLFALLLTALLTGCDTNLIDNPSFDRWCGEDLCDWQTEAGKIERVGSWHKRDYAVSFVDTGTRITQLAASSLPSSSCIRFDTIADVDPFAQLTFSVSFDGDPRFNVSMAVPDANWATTTFVFKTPSARSNVRYTFEKKGEGHAVLAQIWAEVADCSAPED